MYLLRVECEANVGDYNAAINCLPHFFSGILIRAGGAVLNAVDIGLGRILSIRTQGPAGSAEL